MLDAAFPTLAVYFNWPESKSQRNNLAPTYWILSSSPQLWFNECLEDIELTSPLLLTFSTLYLSTAGMNVSCRQILTLFSLTSSHKVWIIKTHCRKASCCHTAKKRFSSDWGHRRNGAQERDGEQLYILCLFFLSPNALWELTVLLCVSD